MTAGGAFERAATLFAELGALSPDAAAARLAAEPDAEVRELVNDMLVGDRAPLSALTRGVPGLRGLVDSAFTDGRRAVDGPGAEAEDRAAPFELASGRFRVDAVLGRGGMGVVYRGHDASIGRPVAIKVLHGGTREQASAQLRFVEEAQVAGQLEHPGIVPIHHLGHDDRGRPFFVMKLIEGRTLAELLAQRSGPRHDLPRFLGHFLRVCQTVAYAHARGVIHRDLKPANVMVGAFGEVQVLDWGLAKVLGGTATAGDDGRADGDDAAGPADGGEPRGGRPTTARSGSVDGASLDGTVMGTPGYMPPEQALGAVAELDRRSDVFSLGAILCEILTGEPPFPTGDRRAAWRATRERRLDPAFTRLARCGADAELVAIARRCLEPEPEDRPSDAGDVAASIERSLLAAEARAHEAMLEAERATARADSERRARRRTLWLSTSAALFFVATLAVVLWRSFERAQSIEARTTEVSRALDVAEVRLWRARQAEVEDLEPWRETEVALQAAERIAQPQPDGVAPSADRASKREAASWSGRRSACCQAGTRTSARARSASTSATNAAAAS